MAQSSTSALQGWDTEVHGEDGVCLGPELMGPVPGLIAKPGWSSPLHAPALPPHCTLHKLFRVSRKGEFINLATFWNNRSINGHNQGRLGGT